MGTSSRSTLVRIGLAVLVVLPPGTYRSLDLLSRRVFSAPDSHLALAADDLEDSRECNGEQIAPPLLPPIARSWHQVTFTSEDQIAGPALDAGELLDLLPLPGELSALRADSSFVLRAPILLGHETARGAVLALHELLN